MSLPHNDEGDLWRNFQLIASFCIGNNFKTVRTGKRWRNKPLSKGSSKGKTISKLSAAHYDQIKFTLVEDLLELPFGYTICTV